MTAAALASTSFPPLGRRLEETVERLLETPGWEDASPLEIARHLGVTYREADAAWRRAMAARGMRDVYRIAREVRARMGLPISTRALIISALEAYESAKIMARREAS